MGQRKYSRGSGKNTKEKILKTLEILGFRQKSVFREERKKRSFLMMYTIFQGGMMTTGISQLQYPHKTEPRA